MDDDILIPAISEAIAASLSKHALPLGIKVNPHNLPWDKTERATFTLLKTAQKNLFVTCFHVLNQLQRIQAHESSAKLVAYMGIHPFLAELDGFKLLDYSKQLDVAVFQGLEDTVELPGLEFIDYESSYLADPAIGEPVSIVGYPGATVTVTQNKADLAFMHILFSASSVSEQRIILADESGDRRFTDFDDPGCPRIALGGLSGSPAFEIRNRIHRFVGIVTDSSEKDQMILISRLGCINRNGKLDHNSIPL